MVKKVQLPVTDWSSDFKNPQCSVVVHVVLDTSAPAQICEGKDEEGYSQTDLL